MSARSRHEPDRAAGALMDDDFDSIVPVAAVDEWPPLLRPEPCECGELPMLVDEKYLCTCPACPHYGEEAWEPPLF